MKKQKLFDKMTHEELLIAAVGLHVRNKKLQQENNDLKSKPRRP